MKKLFSIILKGLEKTIEPHPSITDERKRLEAKMVSFMVLVITLGVIVNLFFGSGLVILSLVALIIGYWISRTKRYPVATYMIIIVLLVSTIRSIFVMGDLDNYTIFTNVAWLTLSLVFASLLLSIKETILISTIHIAIIFLLPTYIPEINLQTIAVSIGYLWVFSTLLIITMWQRNVIEAARQEKIRLQATHDLLTGLPNRILFHDRLNRAIARMERNKNTGSILYLDLDDFKNVNDEYSHEIGDNVLKVIAERINSCIRVTDTGARFSGDEFVILLEDISGSDKAALIAKKLLDTISTPIRIKNSEAVVSGSIGIAMIPKDGKEHTELIQNADTAMYTAKNDGKNAFSFFTIEMKDKILRSLNLSKNMYKALSHQEFYLEFQPQYDSRTGKPFGAEALIRWQHPQRGKITPHEFIPIAEKNGMINAIGEWVARDVFLLLQKLENNQHSDIRVAANISARQLRDDQFLKFLDYLIDKSGINPSLLELEITENSIFENLEHTRSILRQIKKLGIRLAIDDFGTGYSSLSYLEKFPFDTVKIDISFIHKIRSMNVQLPILTGIISIATGMGLDVIAEGVETKTQLEYLKSHGCTRVQGYYYNPSLKVDELMMEVSKDTGYVIQQPVAYNLPSSR